MAAQPALVHACTGFAAAPAESAAGGLRVARVDDLWQHANNLSGWQQQYDQLSRGRFQGELQELWLDDLQVFEERTSQALRQRCRIPEGTLWVGITLARDGSRIDGQAAADDGMMVCAHPDEFELGTPAGHRIFGVVTRLDALRTHASRVGQALHTGDLRQAGWLHCSAATLARLREGLGQVLSSPMEAAAGSQHPQARQHVQQAVFDMVLAALGEAQGRADEATDRPSAARRRDLVRAVMADLQSQPDAVPTVPELCERFHVSRRTLQYAFEDVVGESPAVYLRCMRLNAVQRLLREGRVTQVQDAAAQHGFWSLSQFTADYRRHFGERPSDTRERARAG
ncbi:helix-turn-helix domain-containing protein [Ideonella margarita]|uniref:Helix-turn-helix domain-containing protein n=1 Tax=Ideonella margarita TaxID=2984191 RepID=A0ABU9C7M7_9BURK